MSATTVFSRASSRVFSRRSASQLRVTPGATAVAGALVFGAAPMSTAATATPAVPAVPAIPAIPAIPSVPTADVAAATQAAASPVTTQRLIGFFTRLGPNGAPLTVHADTPPGAAAAAAAAPHLVGATVPVYYLDPAFVTAEFGTAAVAKQEFMATAAVSASGQRASVWTARDAAHGNAWTEFNIASGSTETDMTAAAAKLGTGAVAFYEPQIHAWYGLLKDHVTPLNHDAVRSVGTGGTSLAAYQRLVHSRYADKVPGTAYADRHMLGGFSRGPAKAASGMNAVESIGLGSVGLVGLGGLGGLVGVGIIARRRRRGGPADVR